MKAEQHFREATYWIAKAPPFPIVGDGQQISDAVVIRFPVEKVHPPLRAIESDRHG